MARKHISFRVEDEALSLLQGLAGESPQKRADTERRAFLLGLQILAATTPSYEGLAPEKLASELEPAALLLNNFLARHGQGSFSVAPVTSTTKKVISPSPPSGRTDSALPIEAVDEHLQAALGDFPESI